MVHRCNACNMYVCMHVPAHVGMYVCKYALMYGVCLTVYTVHTSMNPETSVGAPGPVG